MLLPMFRVAGYRGGNNYHARGLPAPAGRLWKEFRHDKHSPLSLLGHVLSNKSLKGQLPAPVSNSLTARQNSIRNPDSDFIKRRIRPCARVSMPSLCSSPGCLTRLLPSAGSCKCRMDTSSKGDRGCDEPGVRQAGDYRMLGMPISLSIELCSNKNQSGRHGSVIVKL